MAAVVVEACAAVVAFPVVDSGAVALAFAAEAIAADTVASAAFADATLMATSVIPTIGEVFTATAVGSCGIAATTGVTADMVLPIPITRQARTMAMAAGMALAARPRKS